MYSEVREEPKPQPKEKLKGIYTRAGCGYGIGFYLQPNFYPGLLTVLAEGRLTLPEFSKHVNGEKGGSFSISKLEVDQLIAGLTELRAQMG